MKEFLQVLKRFVPPYKRYLGLSILFNILSAVLNIFSFAALIPILQILFQVDGGIRANDYMTWNGDWGTLKEVATNNMYYYIQEFIVEYSSGDRSIPGIHDISEDGSLFSFFRHHHTYPYWYRA